MTYAIEQLRHLLHGPAIEPAWWAICDTLDTLEGSELSLAIDYVQGNATLWPDAVRFAPPLWLTSLLQGRVLPQLAIVRALAEPEASRHPDVTTPITDVPDPNGPIRTTLLTVPNVLRLLEHPALAHVTTLGIRFRQDYGEGLLTGLARLNRAPLEALDLSLAVVEPGGLRALGAAGALRGLRSLRLRYTNVHDELPSLLRAWPFRHLETLRLDAQALTAATDLLNHPNVDRLTSLEIGGVELDAAVLGSFLERAQRLEHLNLDRCTWMPGAARTFGLAAPLPALRRLHITGQAAGIRGDFVELASSPLLAGVERLELHAFPGGELADQLAVRLAANPHLTALRALSIGRGLADAGVLALASSPRLTGLTAFTLGPLAFFDNGVTARGITALTRRLALRELRINKARIGDEGAAAIATGPHASSLEVLSLLDCGLGPAGAQALAGSPGLTSLRTLNLIGDPIGDAGLVALASSPHLHALQRLDLYNTQIGDAGIIAVAESVHLPSLRHLQLAGNRPTDAIAPALMASPVFARLDWLDLPASYDLPDAVRDALAGLPTWSLHLKRSLSGGLNPWHWTLDDAFRLPPSDGTIEEVHFHLRTMRKTQLPTLDLARYATVVARHWPGELAHKLRKRLGELGVVLGGGGGRGGAVWSVLVLFERKAAGAVGVAAAEQERADDDEDEAGHDEEHPGDGVGFEAGVCGGRHQRGRSRVRMSLTSSATVAGSSARSGLGDMTWERPSAGPPSRMTRLMRVSSQAACQAGWVRSTGWMRMPGTLGPSPLPSRPWQAAQRCSQRVAALSFGSVMLWALPLPSQAASPDHSASIARAIQASRLDISPPRGRSRVWSACGQCA